MAMEMSVKPVTGSTGSLAGMTALVTGAGSGIGQATAHALSAAGARVIVTELPDRLERAEATVSELQRTGGHALAVELDVLIRDIISSCVGAGVQAGERRRDFLVNIESLNVPQPAF